jgi:hypothetical protein
VTAPGIAQPSLQALKPVRFIFLALIAVLTACADAKAPTAPPVSEEPRWVAPPIAGAREPAFQEALQTWLDGDDLRALEVLAALARQDNRAAQIFLARVASEVHLHWHVTADMTRGERVALLRQPGGLSGRSWLNAAAMEVPLAAAFKESSQIEPRGSALRTLFSYGENTAAMRPLYLTSMAGLNSPRTASRVLHPSLGGYSRARAERV